MDDFGDPSRLIALAMRNCQLLTTELKVINIGTLNVQQCQKEDKQQFMYEDALKYNLQSLGLTETHVVQEDILTITAKPNRCSIRFTIKESEAQINTQVPVFLSRNP